MVKAGSFPRMVWILGREKLRSTIRQFRQSANPRKSMLRRMRWRSRFVTVSLTALVTSFAGPAVAQCFQYDVIANDLSGRYGEQAVASGLTSSGKAYMELWASESGTWSILVVLPNKTSCVLQVGRNFEFFDEDKALARKPSDAF